MSTSNEGTGGYVFERTVAAYLVGTGTALVSQWLSSADASYGLALVVVAAALAWRRRTAFASAVVRE
jgi:MYXO-CTERM domain-containing protein